MADIVIPDDQWDEDVEGTLLGWLLENGAAVKAGEPVVELMVEKVQSEICAPAAGVLVQLKPEDMQVRKGEVIGRIEPAA